MKETEPGKGVGTGAVRGPRRWRARREELKAPPLPLVRPGPRSGMFTPIVVLVAILPGLYALRQWDLTPPGPWWGLRALEVLQGNWLDQVPAVEVGPEAEARVYRLVAMQPPLYAWLAALALALSGDLEPLATALPSYLAGVLVVLLVFLHGRLWLGRGLGATAAVLTGFNRDLLVQMQQATPSTLGLAGLLLALLAYGHYVRSAETDRPQLGWVLAGGFGLGVSLLSVGPLGVLALPIVLLHRGILGPDPWPGLAGERPRRPRIPRTGLVAGLGALAVGLLLAAPWYAWMEHRYGLDFLEALLAPPQSGVPGPGGLLSRLAMLAPASLALGLFGAYRAGRRLLTREADDPTTVGGAFWVAWLALAALAPAFFPGGPRPSLNLLLLVPLNLLAAQAMLDLAARRIPARALAWLAPCSAVVVAWWALPELREALIGLAGGRGVGATTALGLHLGFDLLVGLALATRALDRWARRQDGRRRLVLGGFLGALAALTIATGVREVRFRHRETNDLLSLREAVRRRHAAAPFEVLAVVGPGPDSHLGAALPAAEDGGPALRPGGRLRFLLRTAVPEVSQLDLDRIDDLAKLPEGRRLVILAGAAERLPYAVQARLGLESIHPGRSGVLDAYASAEPDGRPARR